MVKPQKGATLECSLHQIQIKVSTLSFCDTSIWLIFHTKSAATQSMKSINNFHRKKVYTYHFYIKDMGPPTLSLFVNGNF